MKVIKIPTLYSYCIPYDDGAAPNPYWGICTLVICKPVIRRSAQKYDWVVGISSKNSPIGDISNKVVYAMEVTQKLTMQKYDKFCRKFHPNKIPNWNSKEFQNRIGDCIYDFSNTKNIKIRESVHNEKNKEKDLGGKYALISDNFYYFGDKPVQLPEKLRPIIKENQGHKSSANDPYVKCFISWIENLGFESNSLNGEPQLKKNFLKSKEFCAKCSDKRYKEAIKDEEIELKNC